uniref:Putative F-box protein n=1 Tax=Noccaea caerulescens TaxID=107243 RepID=A0A1J3JDZ9_NOCCA
MGARDPIGYALPPSLWTRGVLELKLDIWVNLGGGYSLPFEVFTCKTLVELKLESILEINLHPENSFLPALRTLTIQSVRFNRLSGCVFTKLLSACPVLKCETFTS